MASLDRLQLDGDFFAVGDIDAQINVSERARANFPYKAIFATNDELGPRGRGCTGHVVVQIKISLVKTDGRDLGALDESKDGRARPV